MTITFYEELQLELMRLLRPYWDRVISLDIETKILDPDRFLTDERMLSISIARRDSGVFMKSGGVKIETLFLSSEDDESEKRLLEDLNEELSRIRPLGVIGYQLRHYDVPLLTLKKERYKLVLWKLIDMLESAVHIDLYQLLKYKGYRTLDDAIDSHEFEDLPLKRAKDLVPKDRVKKGKEIYRLWMEEKDKLKMYAEGEVHDILLIAEKLMSESQ